MDSSVLPAIGNIVVPGAAASTIQELDIVLAHALCEYVEIAIFSK